MIGMCLCSEISSRAGPASSSAAGAKLTEPSRGSAMSAPRPLFTVGEANAAVVQLRPVVAEMVEHSRKLAAARREQVQLVSRIAGNGGDMQPSELHELAATIQAEADAIAACAERIGAAGAQIKSLDEGLLDFPSRRDGEEILLCWKLGEDEIGYWHGVDEGFSGRKPL